MGGEIIRPDWGDGERDSYAVVPVENGVVDPDTLPAPAVMLQQMQGEAPATGGEDDPTAGMSQSQIEGASLAAEQILADAPPGFAEEFDTLSAGLQNRVFKVMAARGPNLRGLDLVAAVEDRLTLAEAVEAADWLRALPEDCKAWLRGD